MDLISRQAAIDAICNACGKIDCDKMDKCEKLQLPSANCSEIPNNSDTISRQSAIDALNEQIEQCNKALGSFDISLKDEFAIKVEKASLEAYKEQLENLPTVQPKHGYWTESHEHAYMGNEIKEWTNWYCSECDAPNSSPTDFCPWCGADMRGEAE